MFALELLETAMHTIQTRAAERDSPKGERSMAKAVSIYNAATGMNLTPTQGWLFMVCLKMARSQAGGYNQDDYVDMAAYAGLMGEEEGNSPHNTPF